MLDSNLVFPEIISDDFPSESTDTEKKIITTKYITFKDIISKGSQLFKKTDKEKEEENDKHKEVVQYKAICLPFTLNPGDKEKRKNKASRLIEALSVT